MQSENDIPLKPTSRLGPSAALQDRLKQTSLRETDDIERPSYNKSYLDELRNSTPSTPKDLTTTPDEDEQRILDIEAKFGPSTFTTPHNSTIPSTSEIAEKKARRARLALSHDTTTTTTTSQPAEQDFISLEDYDSDGEFKPHRLQLSSYHAPEPVKNTRLERDDEDIAEGFSQFIEDDPGAIKGRYSTDALQLDRKSRKAHAAKQKAQMKAMIEHAENISSATDDDASDSDAGSVSGDSDRERNNAYTSFQTHRGLDGLLAHKEHKTRERRPKQPKEITPIGRLSVGLGRLREQMGRIAEEKGRVERRLEEVRREKGEVRERQRVVQEGLEGLGREMEALKGDGGGVNGNGRRGEGEAQRGLETFGAVDRKDGGEIGDEMDED